MREIKFRAWEHFLKEMIPVDDIQFYRGDEINVGGIKLKPKPRSEQPIIINTRSAWRIADGEDATLMQYTGLKDKNGKEIYEGDVVHIDEHGNAWTVGYALFGEPRYVVFNQLNPRRDIVISEADSSTYGFFKSEDFIPLEVIGNIYQNPELLQ